MRQTSRALLLFGLLALPAMTACDVRVGENGIDVDMSQGRASDEWTRTYPLSPNGRIEIVNANGQIEALPASGRDVEVFIERNAQGNSDEEALELLRAIEMREQVSPDSIRIEGRVPEGRGFRRNGIRLRYRIRVPAGASVSLRTENGGIRLEDLNAKIEASTTNGGITGEDVSGGVKATAVNGGIRLDMAAVTSDVEASVTNGGVRLELPADIKANLEASCINGGVRVDDELKLVSSETSRGRTVGTLNGGGVKILATTVNGGVSLSARGQERRN